jgi:hypothetical protein
MSRHRYESHAKHVSRLVPLVVGIAVAITGCSKSTTEPDPKISGSVVLGAGATGDPSGTQVQLYGGDPFAPGATPSRVTAAVGSGGSAAFDFGVVGHGDFYVVAWKDDGDGSVDTGDLRGWYNGGVDGTGNPVAAPVHLVHGSNATITITVSPVPAPLPGPSSAVTGDR